MKQLSIEGSSYNELCDGLFNTLKENIKMINDTEDETYGNIRISLKGTDDLKVFIRLLSTYDVSSKEIYWENYVNIYVARYVQHIGYIPSLIFSERYNMPYFDISLESVTSYILTTVFEIPIEDEFKEKAVLNIIVASQSYSKINLEKRIPSVMVDADSFSKYIYTKVISLRSRRPTLILYFHLNVEDVIVPDNAAITDTGVFYIAFSYNDHLSSKYGFGMYNVSGILPSISNESGLLGLGDTIPDYKLTECIANYCAWYFRLRNVLVGDEHLDCFLEEIPYFQEII